MEIKITVASKMAVIKTLSALIALSFLAGCESPEQQAKERTETMQKMAIQVTKHLLDRNPVTISESTNFLRGQELTDDCIAKLSKLEVIPNAGLDVVKEKSLAEDEKRMNVVEVTSAVPGLPIVAIHLPDRSKKTWKRSARSNSICLRSSCRKTAAACRPAPVQTWGSAKTKWLSWWMMY